MNDVQQARYDRFFKAYEDADGFLTFDSVTSHATKLAELRGLEPDSAAVSALWQEMSTTWDAIASMADADKDGRVGRDEFYAVGEWLSGALAQSDSVPAEGPLGSWIQSVFGVIDADSDGRITKGEYADWMTALGLAADTDIDAAFGGFDTNDDGTLSQEEFAECGQQFWTVFDPTVRGHRWIGP